MKVVVDANRLFASILTEGAARRAWFTTRHQLVAPGFLKEEVAAHREGLRKRVKLSAADYDALVDLLLARLEFVEVEALAPHWAPAKKALGAIDAKDIPYLACALAVGAVATWSHDKDFHRQALVKRVGHP